jgi:hypothetical protein
VRFILVLNSNYFLIFDDLALCKLINNITNQRRFFYLAQIWHLCCGAIRLCWGRRCEASRSCCWTSWWRTRSLKITKIIQLSQFHKDKFEFVSFCFKHKVHFYKVEFYRKVGLNMIKYWLPFSFIKNNLILLLLTTN